MPEQNKEWEEVKLNRYQIQEIAEAYNFDVKNNNPPALIGYTIKVDLSQIRHSLLKEILEKIGEDEKKLQKGYTDESALYVLNSTNNERARTRGIIEGYLK